MLERVVKFCLALLIVTPISAIVLGQTIGPPPSSGGGAATCGSTNLQLCYNNNGVFDGIPYVLYDSGDQGIESRDGAWFLSNNEIVVIRAWTNGLIGWSDTAISRDSAGVIDIGNGSSHTDTSGTLQAAHLTATSLANSATTSAVCYNTITGVFTYDGTIGTCNTSTVRVKHDILPLNERELLDGVLKMKPVRFQYNADMNTPGEQLGLIAEDLAQIDPRLVSYDSDGKPTSIRFLGPMMSYLIGAIQKQQAEINELRRNHRRH